MRGIYWLGLAGLLAIVVTSGRTAPSERAVQPAVSASTVLVEILEGVPDQTNWDFNPPKPSESYTENAFGFSFVPTRYSSKGVKVDRSAPFVVRASSRVTLPAGPRKILLRARTGSRLLIDGRILLATKFPNLNADGHEEVPELAIPLGPNIRYLEPGHF